MEQCTLVLPHICTHSNGTLAPIRITSGLVFYRETDSDQPGCFWNSDICVSTMQRRYNRKALRYRLRYYFKRRHGRKRRYAAGSQGGSQSQSESDGDQASHHSQSSASQSSMNWDEPLRKKAKSDSAPSQDEPDKEDDEEITEIMDLGSKKAKTHHPSLDDDADCVPLSATSSSLEALSSGTPLSSAHFFSSCKFYLHLVGKRYSWLRNHIIRYVAFRKRLVHSCVLLSNRFGGKVDNNFTSRLTHLVTCKDNVDEVLNQYPTQAIAKDRFAQAMKVAQKLNPNIKLVSAGWIDKCISTRKLVSIEPFLLS